MSPVEIFGIVVRTYGLSMSIYAIWYLVYGVATSMGLPEDAPGYGTSYYISGSLFLAVGLYFLRGAPAVIRLSYPTNVQSDPGA